MTTGGQIGECYFYLSNRKAVFSEHYSTKNHGIKPRMVELRAAQVNRPGHGLQGARVPQGILGILVWGANNKNSFKGDLLQGLWDMLQDSWETGPAKGQKPELKQGHDPRK